MSGERGDGGQEHPGWWERIERIVEEDRAAKLRAASPETTEPTGTEEMRARLDELRVERHRLEAQLAAGRPEHAGAHESYQKARDANERRHATWKAIAETRKDIAVLEERVNTRWQWRLESWQRQQLMRLFNAMRGGPRQLFPESWRLEYRRWMDIDPVNALGIAHHLLEDELKRIENLSWISDELVEQFSRNLDQLAERTGTEGYRSVSPEFVKSRLRDVSSEIAAVEQLVGMHAHRMKALQTIQVRTEDPDAIPPAPQEEEQREDKKPVKRQAKKRHIDS